MQKINDIGRLSVYFMCAMIELQRKILVAKASNLEDTKAETEELLAQTKRYQVIKEFFESK